MNRIKMSCIAYGMPTMDSINHSRDAHMSLNRLHKYKMQCARMLTSNKD